jgi:acyl carrier protein
VVAVTETTQVLTLDTIRAQVHQFIMQNFLFDGASPQIDDDASLLEQGIVDATGVLELMLFVEDSYGLQVSEADLTPENFDTVGNIARYIAHRLANT